MACKCLLSNKQPSQNHYFLSLDCGEKIQSVCNLQCPLGCVLRFVTGQNQLHDYNFIKTAARGPKHIVIIAKKDSFLSNPAYQYKVVGILLRASVIVSPAAPFTTDTTMSTNTPTTEVTTQTTTSPLTEEMLIIIGIVGGVLVLVLVMFIIITTVACINIRLRTRICKLL